MMPSVCERWNRRSMFNDSQSIRVLCASLMEAMIESGKRSSIENVSLRIAWNGIHQQTKSEQSKPKKYAAPNEYESAASASAAASCSAIVVHEAGVDSANVDGQGKANMFDSERFESKASTLKANSVAETNVSWSKPKPRDDRQIEYDWLKHFECNRNRKLPIANLNECKRSEAIRAQAKSSPMVHAHLTRSHAQRLKSNPHATINERTKRSIKITRI